ncbi:hypothetical protein IW261DRAFT_1289967, partial [Armillaria novae-zelandiae]
LNENQMLAFSIVKHHLTADLHKCDPQQLLMHIQGPGRTGKTVVIKTIAHMFHKYNVQDTLGLMATSGIAATLFGGGTIHS